jgi:hypothetical protein
MMQTVSLSSLQVNRPGIFHENVEVSAKGYNPASATKTFEVTAATPQNTTNTNTTITNTTTISTENNTSSGGNL